MTARSAPYYHPATRRAHDAWTGVIRVFNLALSIKLVIHHVEDARAGGCPGSDLTALSRVLWDTGAPATLAVWVEKSAVLQDCDRIQATVATGDGAGPVYDRVQWARMKLRWEAAVELQAAMEAALDEDTRKAGAA